MGVDVVLKRVSQPGTSPRRRSLTQAEVILDSSDLFARICAQSNLPMLSRVQPYGTLILTTDEMPQFIAEIDSTQLTVDDERQHALLAGIRELAERCAREESMEIHLEGD